MEQSHKSPAIHLEKVRIKRVGIISLANLSAIINLFFGLILGILVTLSSLLIPKATSVSVTSAGLTIGPLAIIIFPVISGIFGWISGFIGGVVYNLASRITKGDILYA